MRLVRTVVTTLALALAAITLAAPASADADDAVMAGAAGFAVGTFLGAATRPYYGGRPYARAYHRPGAYYRRAPFHAYRALRPRWYVSCRAQRSSSSFNKGNFVGYSGTARFCY